MKFEVYYRKVGDKKNYMKVLEFNSAPDEGAVKLSAMREVPDGATILRIVPIRTKRITEAMDG